MKIIFLSLTLLFTIVLHGQTDDAKLANEYYQQGDYEKAETIFEKLSKNKTAIPLIEGNYLDLLISKEEYVKAEKFLKYVIKSYPNNYQYQVSLLKLYATSKQLGKKENYQNGLEKEIGNDQYKLQLFAKNLANEELRDEALLFYKKSRKLTRNPWAYALDLAAIYRQQGDMENMTVEYLNYAEANPRNLSYVKNLFQNLLTEEDDQNYLEKTLISKIQRSPEQTMYAELLIWLELQRKDFYAAFIQAKAMDRRQGKAGDQSIRIGRIASDNKSWDDAIEIFGYVIEQYPEGRNYLTAKRLYIEARESKVKSTYPIDINEIRSLATDYQSLYESMGANPTTLEALRSKALLHAFYLDEKDSAVALLNQIIENRRSPRTLSSKSKLDLGDIYLLISQPWESTLLYSQVEKSNKDAPLGYEAKLRNAKLNYYTGNFSLAKEHLDILKLATTREISNDAIALGVLLQDNTVFDTTDMVMQKFANIELQIFQNKKKLAENQLLNMLKDYPGHSLTDEIYWSLASLQVEKGSFSEAVVYLDKIIDGFNYDILSDDAFYRKGVIQHEYLEDEESALTTFIEFLKAHPGSLYAAEARAKVRKLRGDYIN